jgi:hypothetical protein
MITRPLPFEQAVKMLERRAVVPASQWNPDLWRGFEKEVNQRSFFSANVENMRFLNRAKKFILDTLDLATKEVIDPDGKTVRMLSGGDRATFVRRMREFMIQESMVSGEEEFFDVDQKEITDLRSENRLRLIYETNLRQAYGFGQWKQGQSPAILKRFPAQRFVRDRIVRVKRPRHALSEGEVRLKSDIEYWGNYQNDPKIGGFGVPWAPFGFNSGMGLQDVDREEAIAIGLPVEKIKPDTKRGLNSKLGALVKTADPDLKRKLLLKLRGYEAPDAAERGRRAAQGLQVEDKGDTIQLITEDSPASGGSNFADKLINKKGVTKRVDAIKQRTLVAIEKVHGDGPLEQIEFIQTRSKRYRGKYAYLKSGKALEIQLSGISGTEITTAHEIGHWIDHQAFNPKDHKYDAKEFFKLFGDIKDYKLRSSWGSYGPEFAEFRKAYVESEGYSRIEQATAPRGYKKYLLSMHEGWARAYSQWIAEQSGDEVMIAEARMRNDKELGHWSDEDFAPISKAITKIFTKRGWMRKS